MKNSTKVLAISDKVKVAAVTTPGKIEILEYERPEVFPEDMLMKNSMCGICGTDLHIFRRMPSLPSNMKGPFILGHEMTGTIEEMGKDFPKVDVFGSELNVGDRVVVYPGSWACGKCFYCAILLQPSLCMHPPHTLKRLPTPYLYGGFSDRVYYTSGSQVFKLPDSMPFEVSVLTEPMAVCTRALERAYQPGVPERREGMGPGDIVVVQGSGAIGLLLVILSKLVGASKIIVTGTPENRLKMCKEFGADYTINIENIEKKDRIEQIKKMTPFGQGVDVVFEAAGVPAAFAEGLELLRRGGICVELGHFTPRGTVEIDPMTICYKDMHLYGSYGSTPTSWASAFRILSTWQGKIPFHKIVTHKFPLEQAADALSTAQSYIGMKTAITL